MQSILENLKGVSFLNNKITPQFAQEFPEILSADVFIKPLPISVKKQAISIHKVELNMEILYFSIKTWDEHPEFCTSILITEEFISVYWSRINKILKINFKEINKVEFNGYNFPFFDFDENEIDRSFMNFYAVLKDNEHGYYFAQQLESLITYYNGKNELLNELKTINDNFIEFSNTNNEHELINKAKVDFSNQILLQYDYYVKKYCSDIIPIELKFYEYLAYQYIGEYDKTLEIATNVLELYDGDLSTWYERKALSLKNIGNFYDAILNYTEAFRLGCDSQKKIEYRTNISQLTKHYNEIFKSLPYQDRKLILIDNQLKNTPQDSFIVLDKNNLPNDLQFPNKIAKNKELYIAHPFINGSYIPFVNYEEELATNKFKEFFYFVQCLGAKKITYQIIEGNDSEINSNIDFFAEVHAGVGKSAVKNEIDLELGSSKRKSSIENNLLSTSQAQTFTPTKAPYLPKKLLFYPHELSWHWLYEQRLAGGFDSHQEEITSKKSEIINENEKMTLKVAFKNLFVDTSVNINHLVEETFKQNKLKKWIIKIEFEPIENLKDIHIDPILANKSKLTVSDSEQEYVEEFQFMLDDDGVVDNKERKILERFRVKKGISEYRAIELENSLLTLESFLQNEKDYLEEYQELLNDGEITDKERKILTRMANRLNISEDRASLLESFRTIKKL